MDDRNTRDSAFVEDDSSETAGEKNGECCCLAIFIFIPKLKQTPISNSCKYLKTQKLMQLQERPHPNPNPKLQAQVDILQLLPGKQKGLALGSFPLWLSLPFKKVVVCAVVDTVL